MRVVCVGTGTAVPDPAHVCAGFWVEAGGARLLLDCGPGVVHALARLALPWPSLTHLVISHFHNDHIGDIPFLLFALRWGTLPARNAPLTVVGPAGTGKLLRRLGAAFGSHVRRPDFEVCIRELGDGGVLDLPGGASLRACHTPHTQTSLGFRIETAQSTLGYTSDTGASDDVAGFMRAVQLLITECSLPDEAALETHLTPTRLARMARIAQPGRLAVTHVYPQLPRAEVARRIAAAGYGGPVIVAADGDVFETDSPGRESERGVGGG